MNAITLDTARVYMYREVSIFVKTKTYRTVNFVCFTRRFCVYVAVVTVVCVWREGLQFISYLDEYKIFVWGMWLRA